ncbi:hypothetical protein Q9233_008009 [Columba guinea]|nr:hypothetical protein Q9233_008009 [Columba guinea]
MASRRMETKPVITCLKTLLIIYSFVFWSPGQNIVIMTCGCHYYIKRQRKQQKSVRKVVALVLARIGSDKTEDIFQLHNVMAPGGIEIHSASTKKKVPMALAISNVDVQAEPGSPSLRGMINNLLMVMRKGPGDSVRKAGLVGGQPSKQARVQIGETLIEVTQRNWLIGPAATKKRTEQNVVVSRTSDDAVEVKPCWFAFLVVGTVSVSKKQGRRPVKDLCDVHPALGNNGNAGLSPGEM